MLNIERQASLSTHWLVCKYFPNLSTQHAAVDNLYCKTWSNLLRFTFWGAGFIETGWSQIFPTEIWRSKDLGYFWFRIRSSIFDKYGVDLFCDFVYPFRYLQNSMGILQRWPGVNIAKQLLKSSHSHTLFVVMYITSILLYNWKEF